MTAGPKSHSPEPMLVPARTIPGPIKPDPELPARARRLGKIADLPGGKISIALDRERRLGGGREGAFGWHGRGSAAFFSRCQGKSMAEMRVDARRWQL